MKIPPDKIELYVKIALCSSFPLAIAVGAWSLLFVQLADDRPQLGFNRETLNVLPMAYVGVCSTLTAISILIGRRGLFFRIVQVAVVGTLLLLLVALIITAIERFTAYRWSPEYIVAALFYSVVFALLWICIRWRQRARIGHCHTTGG